MLRETVQVGDDVQVYDLMLLVGEATKVALGSPANLTIVSPWVGNVSYYIGSSGLSIAIPNIAFGKNDIIELLQVIQFLTTNPLSIVQIVTLNATDEKYADPIFQVWELRFLLRACEAGAKIFFYSPETDTRKILHPKFLLSSFGVVFGSFNITRAGRYYNIEDGNYSAVSSQVYFEKKKRIEEIIKKCEEIDATTLRKLLEKFEKKTL